jgi:hypothetical protein
VLLEYLLNPKTNFPSQNWHSSSFIYRVLHSSTQEAVGSSRKSKCKKSCIVQKAPERMVMATKTHVSNIFEIEKCRAAEICGVADLVNCLVPEQASICGCSLPFR